MSAVDVLKSWGVPMGEKFQVTLPEGQCSIDGLRHINDYIGRWCYEQRQKGLMIDLPNPANLAKDDYTWKLLRDSKGRNWIKRYADYVRDISGIKLGNKFLGQLGNAVTHGFTGINTTEYIVDFTDVCDWRPSQFGEKETSCWWTDYDELRMSFFNGWGGSAIRFYDENNRGIGRAMIHGDNNSLFFFNFYERNENSNLDRLRGILEKVFLTIGVGEIEIRGCDFCSNIYINNDAIECRLENQNFYHSYNMTIENFYHCCSICGEVCLASNTTQTAGNQHICNDCMERDDLIECECGRLGTEENVHWSDFYQKFFCSFCYHTNMRRCDMCHERYKYEDLAQVGFHGRRENRRAGYYAVSNVCSDCMPKLSDESFEDDVRHMIIRETYASILPKTMDLMLLDRDMVNEQRSQNWVGQLISSITLG